MKQNNTLLLFLFVLFFVPLIAMDEGDDPYANASAPPFSQVCDDDYSNLHWLDENAGDGDYENWQEHASEQQQIKDDEKLARKIQQDPELYDAMRQSEQEYARKQQSRQIKADRKYAEKMQHHDDNLDRNNPELQRAIAQSEQEYRRYKQELHDDETALKKAIANSLNENQKKDHFLIAFLRWLLHLIVR